ncbi:MAG TPA: hypothetical protein VHW71_04195 [Steroidobacteraceae bacterium]|jgi:hypothetical protein|nr:hypothetical protein [Steroidobacteraceae bacterium]
MWSKSIAAGGLLIAVLAFNSAICAAAAAPTRASVFCAKLQLVLQPFVQLPLVLFSADDETTDAMHAGEAQYRHCQFRQADNSMIDIGLHDDSDGRFDDAAKNGYAVLNGYGDKGRYTVRGVAGQSWLDLVRGKTACEARFALQDDGKPLSHDWKEVGGKVCTAAFSL